MRILKAIPVKQLSNGSYIVLVPELAYLIAAPTAVESVEMAEETYQSFRTAYEDFKRDQYFNLPITNVSLVPTGYCEGGCKYCYAKDGWKLKDYLTPEVLDAALIRNNVKRLDSVIIYGGEPILNWDAYEKLIKHLVFEHDAKQITTATSTFYDDETFKKLLAFTDHMDGRVALSISFDAEGDDGAYLRRYAGHDTYKFVFNRLVELVKHTHSIGFRPTISRISPDPFKLIRDVREATGFEVPCMIGPVKYEEDLALTPEQHQKFMRDAEQYIKDHYDTGEVTNPVQMFGPFRAILEKQNLFSVMKGCDLGTSRLSIMPDGNVSDCTEDVRMGHPATYTKTEAGFNRTLGWPGACQACDFKYMCNMLCFRYFTDSKEHTRAQKQYCEFYQHMAVAGVRFWFSKMTDEAAMAKVLGQAVIGASVEVVPAAG